MGRNVGKTARTAASQLCLAAGLSAACRRRWNSSWSRLEFGEDLGLGGAGVGRSAGDSSDEGCRTPSPTTAVPIITSSLATPAVGLPVLMTSFTASSFYSGVNSRLLLPMMNILSFEVSTKPGHGQPAKVVGQRRCPYGSRYCSPSLLSSVRLSRRELERRLTIRAALTNAIRIPKTVKSRFCAVIASRMPRIIKTKLSQKRVRFTTEIPNLVIAGICNRCDR